MALIEIQHISKDYGTAGGFLISLFRSRKERCLDLSAQMAQEKQQQSVI